LHWVGRGFQSEKYVVRHVRELKEVSQGQEKRGV